MPTDDAPGQVRDLLSRIPRDPKQPYPGGASDAELADLSRRLGTALPDELTAWLRLCKGEAIGPGGVYGVRAGHDIAEYFGWYPRWRAEGWLPVAGDGCGNCYVLLTAGPLAGFVGFVDTIADPDALAYVAASNLWRFLRGLFRNELGAARPRWPFAADATLAGDPQLTQAPAALLPWNS
jgi:cell wall assembly regulator SMI1